jgi:hypothetical protein
MTEKLAFEFAINVQLLDLVVCTINKILKMALGVVRVLISQKQRIFRRLDGIGESSE